MVVNVRLARKRSCPGAASKQKRRGAGGVGSSSRNSGGKCTAVIKRARQMYERVVGRKDSSGGGSGCQGCQ